MFIAAYFIYRTFFHRIKAFMGENVHIVIPFTDENINMFVVDVSNLERQLNTDFSRIKRWENTCLRFAQGKDPVPHHCEHGVIVFPVSRKN
jgi:hypothetical protein